MRQCDLHLAGRFCVNQFSTCRKRIHNRLNPAGCRGWVKGVHWIKAVTVNDFHRSMLQAILFSWL
jgi:hypothetical protein